MPTAHTNPTLSPRVIHRTQRQQIAATYDCDTETVRRWIRRIETACLDWWKDCPDGVTPFHLSEYQVTILHYTMQNRSKRWQGIKQDLLHDPRLTKRAFKLFKQQQKTA